MLRNSRPKDSTRGAGIGGPSLSVATFRGSSHTAAITHAPSITSLGRIIDRRAVGVAAIAVQPKLLPSFNSL